MILLIDAGNSRIKWRLQCASKGRVEAEGALVHDDIDRLATRYESFMEEFSNILQRQMR